MEKPVPQSGEFGLLLEEFRSFRRDEFQEFVREITEWRLEMAGRLSTAEKSIKTGIDGNGTPSRMAMVEAKVSEMQHKIWWMSGAGYALGTLVTLAFKYGSSFLNSSKH